LSARPETQSGGRQAWLTRPGKLTARNAVAVADLDPDVVHFIYHVEYARVFCLRSDDDGRTWSPPKEITSVIEGFRDRYNWLVVGNGCGHALQVTRGPHRGRIVLPVWLSVGTGGHAHRPSDLAVVYSDLAVGPKGTIDCFFERGAEKQNHLHPATLTLARFNVAWLTEPQPIDTKILIGAHHCRLLEADSPGSLTVGIEEGCLLWHNVVCQQPLMSHGGGSLMKTECSGDRLAFHPLGRQDVVAAFDRGKITSDGGALLLREVERKTRIIARFAGCFRDYRHPE
jgi:hypothetical protein